MLLLDQRKSILTPQGTYIAPGEGDEFDPYEAPDKSLTLKIAALLDHYYTGYPWMIMVSHKQGVASISLPVLMGQRSMIIHIRTLKSDPQLHSIKNAAGNILERYGLPRGPCNWDLLLAAITKLPVRARGRNGFVPD